MMVDCKEGARAKQQPTKLYIASQQEQASNDRGTRTSLTQ
jgi:hypothetical protein